MRLRTGKLWFCVLLLQVTTLHAQDAPPDFPSPTGWRSDIGLGIIVNPEYQGGDRYRVLAVPYFDVRYSDRQGVKTFFNVPQGLGTYVVRLRLPEGHRFAVSAALAPGFQNRDTTDFIGLDTFGVGLEARLGAELDMGNWSFRAGLAQGIVSGHGGLYGNLDASYRIRFGRGAFAGLGPSVRAGNGAYMSALYGVSPRESEASGLADYRASSGVESLAFQGIVSLPVGENWRLTSVVRLGELMDKATGSSLIMQPTQFFAVTALTRSF